MNHALRLVCLLLLTTGAPALASQFAGEEVKTESGARGRFPAPAREEVEQKAQLVNVLLTNSPVLARVNESNNPRARAKLDSARALWQRARAALNQGDSAAAAALLNTALTEISAASRQVPDPVQTLQERRAEYAQLLREIELFQNSYHSLGQRMAQQAPAAPVTLDVERIRALVDAAGALERAGDYHAANKVLREAHGITVATLNKLVANRAIVYDLRFSDLAEEFHYELQRHHGYEELIPVAVATLHPSAQANQEIDHYFERSEVLKAQAQQRAQQGDHKSALETIRAATEYLQRALQAVGIVVPQSMDN